MRFAKLVRGAVLSASLALGGCELLGIGSETETSSSELSSDNAKIPGPPPPAPRVARASPRRLIADREGAGETLPETNGGQRLDPVGRDAGEMSAAAEAPEPTASTPPQMAALPPPADLPPPVDPAQEVRPQRVVGLTEKALAQWLGPPANTREESPARVWRYQGIDCDFDVFFYLDLVSREFRALRYDVKGSSNDDQRCLQPVFAGRGAPPRTTASRVD